MVQKDIRIVFAAADKTKAEDPAELLTGEKAQTIVLPFKNTNMNTLRSSTLEVERNCTNFYSNIMN